MTVDFNELKQKMDSITLELKSKAPKDLSLLVETQSFMIKLILEMSSTVMSENKELREQISALGKSIEELQDIIRDLKSQLNQNSNNSSKPPSSDGYKKSPKKRSLRVSTGANVGGQKGHKGAHLSVPHAPDEVKCHIPKKCQCCPNLKTCVASGDVFTCAESRYVIEAKTITHVVEHQIMVATNCPCGCPGKDEKLVGEFLAAVRGYVQYGNSVTVLAALLSTYGEYMFC
jgi:transposase